MDLAIQFTVFLIMAIVGLDLTRADFGRLTERPALVVVATAAQWLLLPVVAWAAAWILPLPPHVVAGIVLLAACPAGAISNYYAFIARADVALSVTLTAISAAVSVVTLPLISAVGFGLLLDHAARVKAPIVPMAIQLIVNLLIPVLIGMWLRARFPEFVTHHQPAARRLGHVALVATVASSRPWRSSSRVATPRSPFSSGWSCSTAPSSRSSAWSYFSPRCRWSLGPLLSRRDGKISVDTLKSVEVIRFRYDN